LLFTLCPTIGPSEESPPTALQEYKGKYKKNTRFLQFAKRVPKYRAKALKQIEKRLGIAPEDDGLIKVVFEDALKADAETITPFRGPPFSTFWNEDADRIVIRLYTEFIVNRRYDARRELTHEMAHAVMRERMDQDDYRAMPAWLREGLALWAAKQIESRVLVISRGLSARGSHAKLFPGLEVGTHTLERYPEDVLAIEYIAQGRGNKGIKRLVRMLVDGIPPHRAVETVTGRRWKDFKPDCRRYSLRRFRQLQPPETARYWRIVDLHKRGRYSRVKRESASFLRDYPKSIYHGDVLYWRGKTCRLRKNLSQAESALLKLIRRHSFHSSYVEEALYQLGSARIESGRFKTAIAPFKQMLRDHPTSHLFDRAVYNLAVCYSRLGKNDEAGRLLDVFLRSFPGSAWLGKAKTMRAALQRREKRGI
jgi:TolA-binding protein